MASWLPERLPEDVEAERSLLATCCAPGMENRAALVVSDLREDDFVVPKHRVLFMALRGLIQAQMEVNALTLKDELARAGHLDTVEGFAGLTELLAAEEVGRPEVLATILQRKTALRKLVRVGAQLVRQASEEEEPPTVLADIAGRDLLAITQGESKAGLGHVERAAWKAMERLNERRDGTSTQGVRVGFPLFDVLTQGFQPGNLIVLAARPGVGKSTLAQNWALNAVRREQSTAFFSLEMSEEELFDRLLATNTPIPLDELRNGREIDDRRMAEVYASRDALLELPLFICDQASITVPQMQAQIVQQGISGKPVKFAIVDYLQLISSPKGSQAAKQNEAVRVGEISRGLKLMAKDLGIPVVVLSQLNREVEHRANGRPQLSDLRDSGAIEQDADMVVFIHRRMQPDEKGESANYAELIVAKHRNGKTRVIPLLFEGGYCRYRETEFQTNPDDQGWR